MFARMLSLSEPLSRSDYRRWMIGLVIYRLISDLLLAVFVTKTYAPIQSLIVPMFTFRTPGHDVVFQDWWSQALWQAPRLGLSYDMGIALLCLITLPFIWFGLVWSVRRAIDMGRGTWFGLLFAIPFIQWIAVLRLVSLEKEAGTVEDEAKAVSDRSKLFKFKIATLASFSAIALGLLAVFVQVTVFGSYGYGLFMASPFLITVLSGYLFNRQVLHSTKDTVAVGFIAVTVTGGAMLLFALEGALCLAMAAPIAYPLAILGTLLGRWIAKCFAPRAAQMNMGFAMIALVAIAPLEASLDLTPPLRTITTSIEIDATPEEVWKYVVEVPTMPEPSEIEFRIGIAYPIRASVDKHAIGGTRICEFNTGEAREVITEYEPARKLAFQILTQPHAMTELTPFEKIHAPHLDGYIKSERGEFRLIALANGRTRLEGQSWYRSDLSPDPYWGLYSDYSVRLIHKRVLSHIKSLAE